MDKITVTIETANAAFEDYGQQSELARVLRGLADKIESLIDVDCLVLRNNGLVLRDINGNVCGKVETA